MRGVIFYSLSCSSKRENGIIELRLFWRVGECSKRHLAAQTCLNIVVQVCRLVCRYCLRLAENVEIKPF